MSEADKVRMDQYRDSINVPEGMRLVGFFCEHPLVRVGDDWTREPHHTRPNPKRVRGWSFDKNVSKSLQFGDYDFELPLCQQAQPMFVRDVEVSA